MAKATKSKNSKGSQPDYRVCVAKEEEGKDTFWTRIGSAWQNEKGIFIKLNAHPIGDSIALFVNDSDDNED